LAAPPEWLGDVERGTLVLSPDNEARVLAAIARLVRFKVTVDATLVKLTANLKIPRLSPPGKARPPRMAGV
jgi:hypothetical protein